MLRFHRSVDLFQQLAEPQYKYTGPPLITHTHTRGGVMMLIHDSQWHLGHGRANNVTPALELVRQEDGDVVPYIVFRATK